MLGKGRRGWAWIAAAGEILGRRPGRIKLDLGDRHERATFRRYFDGAIESRGAFAVIERVSGRIIGSSRFCNLDPGREVEIGWTFLERAFWGGVYNREMKSLMPRSP